MKITIKEIDKKHLTIYSKQDEKKIPKPMTFTIDIDIIKNKKEITISFSKFGTLVYNIK